MTPVRFSKLDQLEYVERYWDKAFSRCLRQIKDSKDALRILTFKRVEAGFDQYGDFMWCQPYVWLHEQELQEYADAPAYRLAKMRQGWS